MSVAPSPTPPGATFPVRKLLLLTTVVGLVHALALVGIPTGAGLFAGRALEPQPLSLSLLTRAPAPAPAPVVNAAPPRPQPDRVKKTATPRATPLAVPQPSAPLQTAEAGAPEQVATEVAPATPATVPASAALAAAQSDMQQVAKATSPPAPASREAAEVQKVQPVQKPAYAPPVLLVYDGKGEERGFIKYAASGELLWAPDGSRYNAQLAISAWGFRVRTWSSKGDLTDAGLQPLRFGDKPRGAELATHFQRDKGFISFSANNPDVPLQAGAQDKLSAILQLGAMVAGEPGRFANGTTITFQAADAHRAELWNFKVGANELLELPGGVVSALKLSKEPTAEFDQRIEVWLAPDMAYLPVRLRITEASGAFADLLWRKTQKPE
jgi:hypothetical protein